MLFVFIRVLYIFFICAVVCWICGYTYCMTYMYFSYISCSKISELNKNKQLTFSTEQCLILFNLILIVFRTLVEHSFFWICLSFKFAFMFGMDFFILIKCFMVWKCCVFVICVQQLRATISMSYIIDFIFFIFRFSFCSCYHYFIRD